MKKIIRKDIVVVNVLISLLVMLLLIAWLFFCLFNKGAMSETYVVVMIICGTFILISVIVSIIMMFQKKDRIEFRDDKIISYRDKVPCVYTWINVKDVHITKFDWSAGTLIIFDFLCSLILKPFCVNVCLLIENEEIKFSVSKRFAKVLQQHYRQTKEIPVVT